MRILFVDQFGELGGAQQCLLDLLPAVLMRGWRATICAPRGLLLERARSLGVEVQAIACGPYAHGRKSFVDVFGFLRDTPQVAAKLRAQAADLLYVNGPRVLPAAALDPRSPVLFHAHS